MYEYCIYVLFSFLLFYIKYTFGSIQIKPENSFFSVAATPDETLNGTTGSGKLERIVERIPENSERNHV